MGEGEGEGLEQRVDLRMYVNKHSMISHENARYEHMEHQ